MTAINSGNLSLKSIASKGLILWPREDDFAVEADHWCCRYIPESGVITHDQITHILNEIAKAGVDFIKVENLYEYDGKRGYSLAQGE